MHEPRKRTGFLRTLSGSKLAPYLCFAAFCVVVDQLIPWNFPHSWLLRLPLWATFYFFVARRFHQWNSRRWSQAQEEREEREFTEQSNLELAEIKQELLDLGADVDNENQRREKWNADIKREFDFHEKVRLCTSCKQVFPAYLRPACPFCNSVTATVDLLAINGWSELDFREQLNDVYESSEDGPLPMPTFQANIIEPDYGTKSLTASDLKSDLDARLMHRDFIGIGNHALAVLFDRMLQNEPDDVTKVLANTIPAHVAEKFEIPASLTYACPHRDSYLPPLQRGTWKTDSYVQLIIFAFVLGATWRNLPVPHEILLPYYLELAKRQTSIIEQLRDQLATSAKEVYTVDDI